MRVPVHERFHQASEREFRRFVVLRIWHNFGIFTVTPEPQSALLRPTTLAMAINDYEGDATELLETYGVYKLSAGRGKIIDAHTAGAFADFLMKYIVIGAQVIVLGPLREGSWLTFVCLC
jgi:hypothetical protein